MTADFVDFRFATLYNIVWLALAHQRLGLVDRETVEERDGGQKSIFGTISEQLGNICYLPSGCLQRAIYLEAWPKKLVSD